MSARCPECGHKHYWTRTRIIEACRAWNEKHGAPPRRIEWTKAAPEHPANRTAVAVFGSWNEMIFAAGFVPRRGPRDCKWTREMVLEAFYVWRYENGRLPTFHDWTRKHDPRFPSSMVVRRIFGTWNGGIIAAGYEPAKSMRSKTSYRASMAAVTKAAA